MQSNETPNNTSLELLREVEGLAKRLVLDEPGQWDAPGPDSGLTGKESVAETLRRISERARGAGNRKAADIAGVLLGDLGENAQPTSLADGLERLQHALGAAPEKEAAGEAPPDSAACLGQDPELLTEFIVESREHLTNIENQLLSLEQDPHNEESLNSAFRGFHTIKGLAGFLDMVVIQKVAHEVETALDQARNGNLTITPEVADVVLAGADFLKAAVQNLDHTLQGRDGEPLPDHGDLIRQVKAVLKSDGEEPAESVDEAGAEREAGPEAVSEDPKPVAPRPAKAEREPGRVQSVNAGETLAVKVNTSKLDHLVDMVGELVVAQSLRRHDPKLTEAKSPRLQRNLSQLSRITTDVQRTAMSMRMVPVGTLFRRMARLVRDLSRKEGKQVELNTTGDETELDRNIVEQLADPLMHMVRNAIGHGLESPEERKAAGKPAVGQVKLSAYHQSGFIMIELKDDGRGLSREKILAKARQRGLIDGNAELSDYEVYNLIFEPGFSTAAVVNDVSGRGVGMDVVKKNILELRGRVEISSEEGRGTTFFLKLPLTLAIIEGLIVGVGEERYIVPIYAVREMLRPTAEALSTLQGREEMVTVRGSLLPVVRLYQRFGVVPKSEDPSESLLLVTENLGRKYCVLVDDLIGKQEVVIKSLGEALKGVPGISGGAILGDGHVGLILDMDGLFGADASA